MNKVLVVYASRHGATRGIAQRIGDVLRSEGLEVEVAPADHAAGVGTADAVVVGSAVYMGSWLKEGIDFIKRNEVDARRATSVAVQQRAAAGLLDG